MFTYVKDCLHEYKAIQRQRRAFKVISRYIKSREDVFSFETTAFEGVVWQFWQSPKIGASVGNQLVSNCLRSVEQNLWENFERKLLDLNDSLRYVRFPEFVYDKLRRGCRGFGLAAFSDILRLALLYKYGGIWLDATMLALRPLESIYILYKNDVGFSFGRSNMESSCVRKEWRHYDSWYFSWSQFSRVKWLSSFIVVGERREVLREVLRILLLIWKYEEEYPHYFAMHIIYEFLTAERGFDGFATKSDVPVHYLQKNLHRSYDESFVEMLKEQHPLQKMSWKIKESEIVNGDTFYNRIFAVS